MSSEREADRILSALAGLRLLALEFSQSSTARDLGTALRVAFVADAAYPWRLVETECSPTSHRRRTRMLSFRLLQEIQRAVEKHLAWATADEQFRANHMATTAGLPGVTGDWVPSKDFALIFDTSRRLLRARICTTQSAQVVSLR